MGGYFWLPCPICGRLAGEFWWEGQLVCRRCRGKSAAGNGEARKGRRATAGAGSGRGLKRSRQKS